LRRDGRRICEEPVDRHERNQRRKYGQKA
jgi:hypothetical protein